jgi:hypothetical protein
MALCSDTNGFHHMTLQRLLDQFTETRRRTALDRIPNQSLIATIGDPPKSPFKRGTLTSVPPFLRGVRGDLIGSIIKNFTVLNILNLTSLGLTH